MNEPSRPEEPFGLQPARAGVTQPHILQWLDPTFDDAEPLLDAWLRRENEEET